MSADDRTFVIVGASLAGAKAAQALREEGFAGRLVLVGEETERPYERPPLSKGYLHGKDPRDQAYVHDEAWYQQHDVRLILGRRATGLDPAGHTVTLNGVEEIRYDRLLLATGSRVRTLDIAGVGAAGVRYLRTLDESDALLTALRGGPQVVVVGAGWIGLEVAAAAREHGCPVTVVEMDSLPLRRVLGDEVAAVFRDLHLAHGVDFRFEVEAREFGSLDGRVSSVVLDDNTELPADLVVVGVGIRPNVELAEDAGLRIDNGVAVDSALRTSDPDIFACGDVASYENALIGRRLRVEHWSNALDGGPAAARSMLGQQVEYAPVPYFFTDQYDLGMEYAGWVEPGGFDQVIFRGDADAREFIAFWVRGGRVLAGMNVNVWDVQDDIQALVKAGYGGTAVDLSKLGDPKVPLGELLG